MKNRFLATLLSLLAVVCLASGPAYGSTDWSATASITPPNSPFHVPTGQTTTSCHFASTNTYKVTNNNPSTISVTLSARLYLYVTSGTNIDFFLDPLNGQAQAVLAFQSIGRYAPNEVKLSGDEAESVGSYSIHSDSHLDDVSVTPNVAHGVSRSAPFTVVTP